MDPIRPEPTLLDQFFASILPDYSQQFGLTPSEVARMALGASSISPIGRASSIAAYAKPQSVTQAAKRVVEAVAPGVDDAVVNHLPTQASRMAQAAQELSLWEKAKDVVGSALSAMGL